MEITKVYKACVKAASVKGKAQRPSRILPSKEASKRRADSFNNRAVDVISNISKLRDFLIKYQTEYICDFSHLVSISLKMSEEERQQIDADAQTFIKSCSNAILSLRVEAEAFEIDDQCKAHSLLVLEILEGYLKDICKLYSQQRAIRVKQTIDRKQLACLKPDKCYIQDKQNTEVVKDKSNIEDNLEEISNVLGNEMGKSSYSSPALNVTTATHDENERKNTREVYFTKEETQMFEEENEQLYQEMNNIVKEIDNIEGKVVEIGRLQEVFQEKVLSQADQIENIGQTAVATTENVKEGNEQIREAIKNSATFRVWILFFLVMCTFSLLFLDWYNN